MTDRNETLADIVAGMRKRVKEYEGAFWMDRIPDAPIAVIYRDFADRIEAAWKCERDELVAKAESEKRWADHYFEEWQRVGNAAKMREALKSARALMDDYQTCGVVDREEFEEFGRCIAKADEALAAPPRNCDVGTAEEQLERFKLFCRAIKCCPECPIYHEQSIGARVAGTREDCILLWAQLPYKAPQEGGDHADA